MLRECFERINTRDINRTYRLLELARKKEYEVCVWGAGNVGKTYGKEALDILGIKIDYYCDRNEEIVDTIVTENVVCKSEIYLKKHSENTICFVLIGYSYIESAVDYLIGLEIKNIITLDDLYELPQIINNNLLFVQEDRIAVYTCITGGYDDYKEPQYISDQCDYYLISEYPPLGNSVYNWINVRDVVPAYIDNSIYQNRYCKMFPHKIFPQYRYSIYIDGNVTIIGKVEKFVKKIENIPLIVPAKCFSDNYYSQMIRMMKIGFDQAETFIKQAYDYRTKGMPDTVGTFFCTILIREHNHPVCVNIMEDWWKEYNKFSNRDQMSFPFVLWENGIKKEDLYIICEEEKIGYFHKNPYWIIERTHKKERYIPYGEFKF